MPIKVKCEVCGTDFETYPSRLVGGKKRCSRKCGYESFRWSPDDFWSKVQKTDGCWIWTGSTMKHGYGHSQFMDRRLHPSHRISWILKKGPIPDGLWVLHKCDNPPCVNPDHLFLGTAQDNTDDMIKKGRGRFCYTKLKTQTTT